MLHSQSDIEMSVQAGQPNAQNDKEDDMGMRTLSFGIATAVLAAISTTAWSQTMEYWVYSDFGTGKAGELQRTFIKEFEDANPGVKINLSAKGNNDLTAGQVAGAASGDIPDVFMNSTAVGSTLTAANALHNIKEMWDAMPEDYRSQFNPDLIKLCQPSPTEMYCIPYTGYGSFMFRNLAVLREAGIDPNDPIETWDQWLAQVEKVTAAGKKAVPDMSLTWWSIVDIYSALADDSEWGADFENNRTLLNEAKYAETLDFIAKLAPHSTGTSIWDQTSTDLFISNELAFSLNGPWLNPALEEAKEKNGLEYDWVLVPGPEAGRHGGVQGYEFIGVGPTDNAEMAFKFAAHVAGKEQMVRWAGALGRFNSNDAALNDPAVKDHPLLAITREAVTHSLLNKPPFFKDAYPSDYWQIMVDNSNAVIDGDMTAAEAAEATIEQLNEVLEDR